MIICQQLFQCSGNLHVNGFYTRITTFFKSCISFISCCCRRITTVRLSCSLFFMDFGNPFTIGCGALHWQFAQVWFTRVFAVWLRFRAWVWTVVLQGLFIITGIVKFFKTSNYTGITIVTKYLVAGTCTQWSSDMVRGGSCNFLVRLTVTFIWFAQICFIPVISKFVSFQIFLYCINGMFGCFSWKWTLRKYLQIAGSDLGHRGQWIGALEHGKEFVDSDATL